VKSALLIAGNQHDPAIRKSGEGGVQMTELARDEEFSAFVLARRPELLRSACLLTAGDWHSAEDLVQTALAKLYVAWPRVRRTGTQVAYAWRILVNAHIDEVRRPRWRREQSVAAPPDMPDPGALAAFPDGLDGGAVRAALAALPPGMRAAVVLRHWADFNVEETAQILGCSAGTVKSQTAKGIARLRELLGDAVTPLPAANNRTDNN
jgi:RNA polymerase sigma-70 factor (sigma-E family)